MACLEDERYFLPPIGDWTNDGYDCYKEVFGEARFKEGLSTQFKDQPESDTGKSKFQSGSNGLARKLSAAAFFTGRNLTHPYGVLLTGEGKTIASDFPECSLFGPNQTLTVKVRHSNSGREAHDDAGVNIRALSVSFCSDDPEQRLDLLCNTGRICHWYNLPGFQEFLPCAQSGEKLVNTFIARYPYRAVAYVDAVRRAPDSFSTLHYYGWTTYCLKTDDGKEYQARFRIIPPSGEAESVEKSGLLPSSEQKGLAFVFDTKRHAEERRPADYLRKEIVDRVRSEKAYYKVQIQYRDSLDYEYYNPSSAWDESECPWKDVIEFSLDTVITDADECARTQFSMRHMPPCLYFPEPADEQDFRSIARLRMIVYEKAQKARLWTFRSSSSYNSYCPLNEQEQTSKCTIL